jgi:hypothetical protein
MNPPTEQLIRDYLNRLSVAARGHLGFSERQSLLDRTRARIEAECGGINGASAVQVRKALAGLGDPIALVELELSETGGQSIQAGSQHDPAVTGNGNGMVVSQVVTAEVTKGNEIGKDMPAADGPDGSRPARVASSVRSMRAGFAAAQRRRRTPDPATSPAGLLPAVSAPSGRSGRVPRQRTAPELLAAPDPIRDPLSSPSSDPVSGSGSGSGNPSAGIRSQTSRFAGPRAVGVDVASGLLRGTVMLAVSNKLEVLAIALLAGGAIYPPVWLLGALLALPSRRWDIRDKFLGITLPVMLVIVGTALVLVFGGQHSSIGSYAFEAWLGAERLSRALALAGATYLLWALHRGRRQPKQPPWKVPGRPG